MSVPDPERSRRNVLLLLVIRHYSIELVVDRTVAGYENHLRSAWGRGQGREQPETAIQPRAGRLRCGFPEG